MTEPLPGALPTTLAEMEHYLRTARPEQLERMRQITAERRERIWLPQPGPQSEAYYHQAEELLYGGAAGGGKTDLLIGLAMTAHRRSLIFRSQSVDLDGLWDRLVEVASARVVQSNDVKRRLRIDDGRMVEGGYLGTPGSERGWMGRPHDLIGFDEAAQLPEARVIFVLQWLRTSVQGQRTRAVFATNPPIPDIGADGRMAGGSTGDWLMRWFAPWLDPAFPNPAKPGEIRWCYMKAEGGRYETIWVDEPGVYSTATGERINHKDAKNAAVARSRTFVRSRLDDNAFLANTGYAEKLSGVPEPLRSMLLEGDFTVRGEDHPMQIIPTQWVLEAQERWQARSLAEVTKLRQVVLYADVAQGGADMTVLAPLCETAYFDETIATPGVKTPTGKEVVSLLLAERLDSSMIVLDGTGGWAGATRDLLSALHGIEAEMHVASKTDGSYTPDGVWKYANERAAMWWGFRLALDPRSGHDICLPPSVRLRVQLTAPLFEIRGKELIVESKDQLRKRLGSSTDEADGVLGAWRYYEQAVARLLTQNEDLITRLNRRANRNDPQKASYDDYDPRGDW